MKKAIGWALLLGTTILIGIAGCKAWTKATGGEVPRMAAEELRLHLNDDGFVVIDVRSQADWEKSALKIKGAIREISDDVSVWASKYPMDKTIVLYCA